MVDTSASYADLFASAAEVLRPVQIVKPSVWVDGFRPVTFGPYAGTLWDNTISPYLIDVMDAAAEALATRRDLLVMKMAQGGVTDALGINVVAWLLVHHPGPILYLTNVDKTAEELVHDRWDSLLRTWEPLKKRHLSAQPGWAKAKDRLLVKRFVDAKLALGGSRALSQFLSNPYAVVVFDELDSCQDEMGDGSDPIELVRRRMAAFAEARDVLMIAFAHPSERDRGAAKIYYEESDQRRGHVVCPHCGSWVAPLWKHVHVFPREGMTALQAERDPTCYELVAACCGARLSNADRLRMIQRVEQRSTLTPEEAAKKRWIGLHVWHLFSRRLGQVELLARSHVAGLDNPGVKRVFVNKDLGEPLDDSEQEAPIAAWEALLVDDYSLGQVPAEVQFLTSGQDSKLTDLHWSVWGWGLVRTAAGVTLLCGWLVDAGVEPGPAMHDRARKSMDASDLAVFDAVLYDRTWPRRAGGGHLAVDQGLHDSGWQPAAVYDYTRAPGPQKGRAYPSKGAGEDSRSKAPLVRWVPSPTWRVTDARGQVQVVTDASLQRADMNTYQLKNDLLGWPTSRFAPAVGEPRARLVLPSDTPPELLQHLASERLVVDQDTKKKAWKKFGANHWLDTAIMAYAAAKQLEPFLEGRTRAERLEAARSAPPPPPRRRTPGVGIQTTY